MSPRKPTDSTETFSAGDVVKMLGIAPVTLRSILEEHGREVERAGDGPRAPFTAAGVEKLRELRATRKKPRGRAAAKAKQARMADRRKLAEGSETPRRGKGARVVTHRVAETRSASPKRRAKPLPEAAATSAPVTERPPGTLSLKDIERATGVSYPTLMRYAKDHADKLPSIEVGSRRYYLPEAIDVVREVRSRSKAGRKKTGQAGPPAAAAPVPSSSGDLAAVLAAIEARLSAIEAELRKPLSLAVVRG
jgi:hypothetical protein